MKLQINRFADADNVNVSINVKTSGGKDIKKIADTITKLDAEVTKVTSKLQKFQTTINTINSESSKGVLGTDPTKNLSSLSKLVVEGYNPKQLSLIKEINKSINDTGTAINGVVSKAKTLLTVNSARTSQSFLGRSDIGALTALDKSSIKFMLDLSDGIARVGDVATSSKAKVANFYDMIDSKTKKDVVEPTKTNKFASVLGAGYDSKTGVTTILGQNETGIDVVTELTTRIEKLGGVVETAKPKVASFFDMINSANRAAEESKEEPLTVGSATKTMSILGRQDLKSMTSAFSDESDIKFMTDLSKSIKEVGNAAVASGVKVADFGDMINNNTKKLTPFQKLLEKLPKNMKEFESGIRSLSLVRMMYIGGMLKRVFSSVFSAVKGASDYTESLNLAIMSFGKQGNINVYDEYIKDWAFGENGISTKLLLDQQELLQYVGTFNNLTKGLGVASEDAITMSKNLTQLTYDMSSYLNIDVESASAKLVSAMNGETRAVGKAGVAMQAASLQELAYTLGIDKKVAKMTQAEKTYLRYIQVMRNTQQMQGDLARTSTTPANAMRALTTAVAEMGRAIGQLLTPFIVKVIPWIIAFTNVVKDAAVWVANLFNIKVEESEPKDFTDMFEDMGDSVEEAGKKVKNSLAPFDDLNVVMSSAADSGDMSTSTVLKELQKYVDGTYNMLDGLIDDNLVDKAKELEKYLKPVLLVLSAVLGAKTVFNLGKWLTGGISALTGSAATKAMATGSFGWLMSQLLVGAAASIIIGCTVKIIADEIKLHELYTIMSEKNKDFTIEVGEHTDTVEDKINSGNKESAIDTFKQDSSQAVYKADSLYKGFLNSNPLEDSEGNTSWKIITGGALSRLWGRLDGSYDIAYDSLDDILTTFYDINNQADKLINSGELTTEEATTVRETLRNQRDYLKELLKDTGEFTPQGKRINKALDDTKASIRTINDKYFPKTINSIGIADRIVDDIGMGFGKTTKETQSTSKNLKAANETMSVSETKTSTWGRLLGGVSNTVTTIKNKLLGNNDELDDSNNKTTLLGKAVNVVKGLFGDTEGEVENMNNQLNIGSSKTDEMYRLWSLIKGELPGIEDKIKGVNMTTEDWRTVLEAAGVTVTDDLLNNFVEFSKTAKAPNKVNLDTKDADTWLDNLKGDIKDLKNPIKLKFSSTFEGLSSLVKNVGKAIFGEKSAIGKTFKLLGFDFSGFFAEGGYPTAGDLFFANENGRAEFITSIGNKTAVANQDQMVQALSNAIMAGFNAMNANNNTTRQPINVNIGNERVYSGVVEYQNRQSDRYGTTTTLKI